MTPITNNELQEIGFKIDKPYTDEDNLTYQSAFYEADDYYIAVTTEFDADAGFLNQFVTINDRDLSKKLSLKELKNLILILFKER